MTFMEKVILKALNRKWYAFIWGDVISMIKKLFFVFLIVLATTLGCGCERPDSSSTTGPSTADTSQTGFKSEQTKLDMTGLKRFSDGEHMKLGSGEEEFYTSVMREKDQGTAIYRADENKAELLWESDDMWEFSLVDESVQYDNVLFNGHPVDEDGNVMGSDVLFVYVRKTGNFASYFDPNTPCSNAVVLPTEGTNYEGLAWVLWGGYELGSILVPVNLKDGGQELGQSVVIEGQQLFNCDEGQFVSVTLDVSDSDHETLKLTRRLFEMKSDRAIKVDESTYGISISDRNYWSPYR